MGVNQVTDVHRALLCSDLPPRLAQRSLFYSTPTLSGPSSPFPRSHIRSFYCGAVATAARTLAHPQATLCLLFICSVHTIDLPTYYSFKLRNIALILIRRSNSNLTQFVFTIFFLPIRNAVRLKGRHHPFYAMLTLALLFV